MEKLITLLANAGFSPVDVTRITQAFTPKTFQKNEYLLQEGAMCRQLGFVDSGLFMFFMLVNGGEKTTYVVCENGFVTFLWSFLTDRPATENIRCIRPGQVWLISKTSLRQLQQEVAGFLQFYVTLLEREICCVEESRYNLIALSAGERYEKLLRESPQLLNQLSLQHLAALLGITGRHLSRIRARQLR